MKSCFRKLISFLIILSLLAAPVCSLASRAFEIRYCVTWMCEPEVGKYVAQYYLKDEQIVPPDVVPSYETEEYRYVFLGWKIMRDKNEILAYFSEKPGLLPEEEFVQEPIPVMKEKDVVFSAVFRLMEKTDLTDGVLTGKFRTVCSAPENYPWYENRSEVKKIVVEDGIESLGPHAFQGYENLEEILLPESLKKLGDGCFADCPKLARIRFGAPLEEIGEGVFRGSLAVASVVLENQRKGDFLNVASLSPYNLFLNGEEETGLDTASLRTVYTHGVWPREEIMTEAGAEAKRLDINKDGITDISDVMEILNHLKGADISWAGVYYDLNLDGATDVDDISVLLNVLSKRCAHVLEIDPEIPPTETEPGREAHYYCAICEGDFTPYREIQPI